MALDFKLDLTPLRQSVERSPETAGKAAVGAMGEIKDDWVREARDIAPIDSSNLRKQISGEVDVDGLNSSVIVTGDAVNDVGGRFNYGYYIHEMDAGGGTLQTPGTEKKFLDKSTDESRWQALLEKRVLTALRKEGWN